MWSDCSIESSLAGYFGDEDMSGDNAYDCGVCNRRTDAIRRTEMMEPPTILSLQLLRNVYDRQTFQKVKLKVFKYTYIIVCWLFIMCFNVVYSMTDSNVFHLNFAIGKYFVHLDNSPIPQGEWMVLWF